MPAGTPQLLGHGLTFCVKPASTNDMIRHAFSRLEKDMRQIWALRGSDDDDDYNPSIHLKSDYEFKLAPIHTEQAPEAFKIRVKRLRKPKCNLSPLCMNLMEYLKNNNIYSVVHGDKNLGPCILEHSFYIYKGFAEHLGNKTNYKPLSARTVHCKQRGLQYLFRNWMSKFKHRHRQDDPVEYVCLTKAECTFLYRAIK